MADKKDSAQFARALGDCDIEVQCQLYPFLLPVDFRQLRNTLAAYLMAIREAGYNLAGINLVLCADAEIWEYNKKFLACPGPTNILSFPGDSMPGALILSLTSCNREAMIYGQEEKEYLFFLLAHGCAHLAGFEHGDSMDQFIDYLLVNTL